MALVMLEPSAGGNPVPAKADADDSMHVAVPPASTAAHTNVASSASSTQLLAANTARKGFSIFNDSTQILYVKYGATASATSYVVQIAASGYYEDPWGWQGAVHGIWASANGNARILELT
jgi:archaellum component FlaG (FlaF/FlaG flagellin family)